MKPIASIILNQNVINNNTPTGQVTVVEAPFIMLPLPFIPSAASFNVLAIMTELDLNMKYNIRITLHHIDYDDEIIFDTGINPIGPLRDQGMIEIDNLNLDINVTNAPIEHEGTHVITLYINDFQYSQNFIVKHKPIKKHV